MRNCRWSGVKCKGVVEASLTGATHKWFSNYRAINPSVPLNQYGKALVEEFKNPLSEPEAMLLLIKDLNRPSETYHQFMCTSIYTSRS
ncbi:hypothetical protein PHMEG_0008342 [Phytophthora megakarya]|uniref:Uncharacterized protein n=1 Tax=Phytophthora megakarya TaxID=4795 RepID=A0A225WL41_9STRA|nr:hypothetical protein PHMEG_0008342 [Phytophthora megakarya]